MIVVIISKDYKNFYLLFSLQVFEELTPRGIEIIKPEILPDIQDFIAARVNDTIYHLTMRDVLTFLIGENEIRNNPHLLLP